VIEGVDNAAADGFLGLRDQREGHLIDVAHVREREALIGVGVVEDGSTDGGRGVDSEELLESTVRGGNPRGAADGEGLEEALSALLANALAVLLACGERRGEQKVRERRRGSTLGSNANANEESVRDRRDSTKNDGFGPRGRRIRAFRAFWSRERATGSVHGDREARGATERA
jgi:hypothetical protein